MKVEAFKCDSCTGLMTGTEGYTIRGNISYLDGHSLVDKNIQQIESGHDVVVKETHLCQKCILGTLQIKASVIR